MIPQIARGCKDFLANITLDHLVLFEWNQRGKFLIYLEENQIEIFQFMVGTRKGKIISNRMQPKAGSTNMILGVFDDGKRARVAEVERNPFYPKNFLVIRDYSAKIWCEDIKTSPIMWMKQSPAR